MLSTDPTRRRLYKTQSLEAQEVRAQVLAALAHHLAAGQTSLSHALSLMPDDPDFYAADLALDEVINQLDNVQAGLSRL